LLVTMTKRKTKHRTPNTERRTLNKKGAALLVVLFVIMAITILSLGFLSRSDVELSCGQNMILRTQMDYLAESGLEHAKGLILNPQDIGSEYWTGATGQQLVAESSDFYDVKVVRNDPNYCNYIIDCNAYRRKGSETVGRSSLRAELRLDPCVALWKASAATWLRSSFTINGDVYCNGELLIDGVVNGDVFAAGPITGSGSVAGRKNAFVATPPVSLPGIVLSDFSSQYYYNGLGPYSVRTVDPNYDSWFPEPGPNNPARVYYRNGDLELRGNINITGMLVVTNDLRLKQNCNLTIAAVKDFPALLVGHDIKIENVNQRIDVTGLAQVNNDIDMANKAGSYIKVVGALYVGGRVVNTDGCTVKITAFADKAAVEIWPTASSSKRWTPAAGAFFRSIQRK